MGSECGTDHEVAGSFDFLLRLPRHIADVAVLTTSANQSSPPRLYLHNRLCERIMAHDELRMTPAQMASLLDSALRHPCPLDFLDAVVVTLRMMERTADGTTAAWIGCLLAEEEMEILMGLRAAWQRGEDRSPAEAARVTITDDR